MASIHNLNQWRSALDEQFQNSQHVQVLGVQDSFAQVAVYSIYQRLLREASIENAKKLILILPSPKDFPSWSAFLECVLAGKTDTVSSLPFYSSWGHDRFVNQSLVKAQRVHGISKLVASEPSIILTTMQALGQYSMTKADFKEFSLRLKVQDERNQQELAKHLEDIGYKLRESVDEEGTYAIRGGIFDIYALNYLEPLRLGFLGDTIQSIRQFSLENQLSKRNLEEVSVCPAEEAFFPPEKRDEQAQIIFNAMLEAEVDQNDRDGMMNTFLRGHRFQALDMFLPILRTKNEPTANFITDSDVLIFPKSIESCINSYKDFLSDIESSYRGDVEGKRPIIAPQKHFSELANLEKLLSSHKNMFEFGNPYEASEKKVWRIQLTDPENPLIFAPRSDKGTFDFWIDKMSGVVSDGGSVAILAQNNELQEKTINLVTHRNIPVKKDQEVFEKLLDAPAEKEKVIVGHGMLNAPLWIAEDKLLIIPDHSLFGRQSKKNKPASKKLQSYLSSFKELQVGGLVVHMEHGVGRYKGMTSLEVQGLLGDFLILEYQGGDKLYLPVDKLNLLQRYNSGSDEHSSIGLDKLRGQGWERRKSRVKKEIKDMAEQLIKLQAERHLADTHVFGAPSDEYFRFESEFDFEETDDQLRAIADTNHDLSVAKPMDRLVCGDVGFGKTEVALRATYRVVLDGYQVLILVPTTVLCYQHYRTFSARLAKHGVRIAQVNRFVKASELKEALDGLQRGQVDVLIGTHRLFSKDIKPKKLGLLVVDEEQRFGVAHKEKLKELRAGCDVLTLTATPIPRTLHMAMLGLRDISIITTPPHDRLAVKTYISKFDENLIKSAIEQEVNRGGQVFFVHNRVQDIVETRNFIKSLVPKLDVRIAHGQMPEHQLEKAIVDFIEQKFSVLVCTTIIESGIDMPNVNTLIVDRADRYGLAQLYQLKGRVGRSTRQAYAYFFTTGEDVISDDAKKRLDVISTHQELGAGFQIASHDLEIRGAGNLLGGEQSGKIAEVGLEMYTEMLEQAINELRGKVVKQKVDTEIKLPISAVIPKNYIESENQRLHLYKSLFSIDVGDDIGRLLKETIDRYGPLPSEAELLFKIAELKLLLRICGAISLGQNRLDDFEIKFGSLTEPQIGKILSVITKNPDMYRISPDYKMFVRLKNFKMSNLQEQRQLLEQLIAALQPLAHCLEDEGT